MHEATAQLDACRLLLVERACNWLLLGESVDALLRAVEATPSQPRFIRSEEIVDRDSFLELRNQLAASLIEIAAMGEPEVLFTTFCAEQLTAIEANASELHDIGADFIHLAELLTSNRAYEFIADGSDSLASYVAISRVHPARTLLLSQLLAPLHYFAHAPFVPLSGGQLIPQIVIDFVSARDSASIVEILRALQSSGIYCTPAYLSAVCLSQASLLSFVCDGDIRIALIARVLPRFELAAFNLDEKMYSWWRRQSAALIDEKGYDETISIMLDPAILKGIHGEATLGETTREINWFEVTAKTLITRREIPKKTVQDVEEHLHSAIVSELQRTGRAMQLAELERNLGLTIELTPDLLGPGRVMAYSRNPRFLHRDSAYYVLADWVETEFEKKNRIARDRIVTPFRAKAWEFSADDLPTLCAQDEMVKQFAIYQPKRLIDLIARRLPDMPVEPYYLKKIAGLLRKILERYGVDLGEESYVLPATFQFDVRGHEKYSLRRRVLGERLGVELPLKSLHELEADQRLVHRISSSVSDEQVAEQLLAILRIRPADTRVSEDDPDQLIDELPAQQEGTADQTAWDPFQLGSS